jgi:hypothetical protein
MGCDIHIVLEKKFGEKWIGMRELSARSEFKLNAETCEFEGPIYGGYRARDRNYELFAALAGVRGEGPKPKGLPSDVSDLSRAILADYDGLHSHSYCSISEYIEKLLLSDYEPAKIFLTVNHPAVARPYEFYFSMYPPEEDEEYRVVFAFDN